MAQFIAENDFAPGYNRTLTKRVLAYSYFLGRSASVTDLTYDNINRWLQLLLDSGRLRKPTVEDYKRNFRTLWNHCGDRGLCEHPNTRRIKRIKLQKQATRAFTHDEIHLLIASAETLQGEYSEIGVSRAAYWQSLIAGAYDLGARRADLWLMPSSIVNTEPFSYVDGKTQRTHTRKLSSFGAELLAMIKPDKRELAWPWHRGITSFRKAWGRIRDASGLDGQFKWLRRSSGSYAGSLNHANGKVFDMHYRDYRIAPVELIEPPSL